MKGGSGKEGGGRKESEKRKTIKEDYTGEILRGQHRCGLYNLTYLVPGSLEKEADWATQVNQMKHQEVQRV